MLRFIRVFPLKRTSCYRTATISFPELKRLNPAGCFDQRAHFMGGMLLVTQTKIANRTNNNTVKLSSFIGSSLKANGIAFDLKDYLELADWAGRIVREDKRGFINPSTPNILQKLQLDEQTWLETVQGFSKGFYSFVGPEAQLKTLCQNQKKHWVRGINACRRLFNNYPIPIFT